MPNGNDRNWKRLCSALEGFYTQHGHWPTRVRAYPDCLQDLKERLFLPETWRRLTDHLEFIPDDEAPFIAEDPVGNSHSYGSEVSEDGRHPSAGAWLGIAPDAPGAHGY